MEKYVKFCGVLFGVLYKDLEDLVLEVLLPDLEDLDVEVL